MSLQHELVRKIGHLARLNLSPEEVDSLTRQLSAIVTYVDQLRNVDTAGIEPFAHPFDLENVFREDDPQPSLDVEIALANAPLRHGDFYRVPAVLD
jgi:aspartyl-tRNA(Asn)/glutamyl-tRNA(Gln) amidotransferase subunit C